MKLRLESYMMLGKAVWLDANVVGLNASPPPPYKVYYSDGQVADDSREHLALTATGLGDNERIKVDTPK